MIRVDLIGNLGKDPEMKFMPSGDAMTTFSVAVNERRKDGDAWKDVTIWWRVAIFGKQAEACNEYLKRGSKVYVTGSPTFDIETGAPRLFKRQNGEIGTSFELRAYQVEFLSPKTAGASTGSGHGEAAATRAAVPAMDDSVPDVAW